MMDLDSIAQRLEELSVDLDVPELAALAEEMIGNETMVCGPECSRNRDQVRRYEDMVHSILSSVNRVSPEALHNMRLRDDLSRFTHQHYAATWASSVTPKNMAAIIGGTI